MEGLWGKPFASLDHLTSWVSTQKLPLINREIRKAYASGLASQWSGGGFADSGDPEFQEVHYPGEAIKQMTSDEREAFYKLNPTQDPASCTKPYYHYLNSAQHDYLVYRKNVYFAWQHNLTLRSMDHWKQKHVSTAKIPEEIQQALPQTLNWIEQLPFKTWGRATVFGSAPFCPVPTHSDTRIRWFDDEQYPEFLFIRLGEHPKKFYIYDEQRKERHFVNSRITWFNECDYHGVAPQPRFACSLRVDGVFSANFRREVQKQLKPE